MVNFIIGLSTTVCLLFIVGIFIYAISSISILKFIFGCFILLILVISLFGVCLEIYEIGEIIKTYIKEKLNKR